MPPPTTTTAFIDESIHADLGFIASALVFDNGRLTALVADALQSVAMEPGREEFKSGVRMDGNPKFQALRYRLLSAMGLDVRIAVVFTPSVNRSILGRDLLEYLTLICRRNGIEPALLQAYFDEGLFPSVEQAKMCAAAMPNLQNAELNFEQDSKRILGIQVADAVAHTLGQVLKHDLLGNPKKILLGETEGYTNGTPADLGWTLLMSLRYALFHRLVVYQSNRDSIDPPAEPKIISQNEDSATYQQHPELFGWGIFAAPGLSEKLRGIIEDRFAKIWLGCIH